MEISLSKGFLFNSIFLFCVTLPYSAWLCKPYVMWLLALGKALLGFPWENVPNFITKDKRKAHSLATTATTVEIF